MVEFDTDELISEVQRQKWREDYSSRRYLAYYTVSELGKRLEDILLNLLIFSEDGLPLFDQSIKMSGLIERLMHVDEEMRQRGNPLPSNFLNNPKIYKDKYPNILSAIKAWNNRKPRMGEYLVKFGQKKYLQHTMDTGNIRLNPASSFDDPSLNQAVRDSELSQTVILPIGTKIQKKLNSGEFKEIKNIRKLSLTSDYHTDFYVYCMGKVYQHRLFDDFGYNACLLIYDIKKFLDKFLDSVRARYPDWLLKSGEVEYYDPHFPGKIVSIPFCKNYRYWYQCEFRIVIKPKVYKEELKEIDIELGPLDECCELIII